MKWRKYQEETKSFFESIGCDAECDFAVQGVRATHKVDVWVRFNCFGLETKWVIECKYWKSPVTKEKVLALASIVDDVGADRGILISTAGFQSGAIQFANSRNITLSNLDELKEKAVEDLNLSILHVIEIQVLQLKQELFALVRSKELTNNDSIICHSSRIIQGFDAGKALSSIGRLSILETAFDQIRLKKSPYPVPIDTSVQQIIKVKTIQEFIEHAKKVILDVTKVLII